MKYTPGPWTANDAPNCDGRLDVEADGFAVALVCSRASSPASGQRYFERAANARLIAAAPDMFAALQEVRVFLRNGIELGYIRMPDLDLNDPASLVPDLVSAALAKAEGRS